MKHRWSFLGFFVIILLLVIFSYTQVDLNLTLSSNHIYQQIQNQLILIGYYQRPFSTAILTLLLIYLFGFYLRTLKLIVEKKLTVEHLKWLVAVTSVFLFAYPEFSHDLFNYMFDARVVTEYHLDPHFFKALDFPLDPWVRFMRWTHRYYPYGPGWLILTLIPSYLGMGKFVLTMFLFKLMFLGFYLGNLWLIWQIGGIWGKEKRIFATVFYALNPLVLIESLVSPHNEVMMLSGVLVAVYFLQTQKNFLSAVSLTGSIAVKFVSAILIPLFLFKKHIDSDFFRWSFWLWTGALIPVILQREPYSWYLIPLIAFAALSRSKLIQGLAIALSASFLSRYLPFILFGDYSGVTLQLRSWLMWGIFIVMIGAGWVWAKN